MISVIIPTYQHAKTIVACIQSLLAQTLPPDEIIVIDDGSTDETKELLKQFDDKILYRYQPNQGAPTARNVGAGMATGNFLFFCDADIRATPHLLKRLLSALTEHPEVSYAYSGFYWGRKRFKARPFDADALQRHNYIHTAGLIRTEHFPGFDPSLKRFQDWDLYLTLLEQGHTGVAVDELLFTVQNARGRKGISTWLPAMAYRLPWNRLRWKPRAIADYQEAERIVKHKHNLL